jgi:hypothetical protein
MGGMNKFALLARGYNNEEGTAYTCYDPPEETTKFTFNGDIANDIAGTHTLRVGVHLLPREEETANSVKALVTDVRPERAGFIVETVSKTVSIATGKPH